MPTVTTSLSGFGQWVLSEKREGFQQSGVEVVNRTDSNYGEVVEKVASDLRALADAPADLRERISKAARETAERAEWNNFTTYYVTAFRQALDAADKRRTY